MSVMEIVLSIIVIILAIAITYVWEKVKIMQFNIDVTKARHTSLEAHTCRELSDVLRKLKNLGQ
jgi:cell division protein FtsL